ncbi:MAG: autotransporter-associated beta strand repeat-containing protein [Prosthecobacter sp.]|uniref:autotransporter-associated beta strand repeat-containing protein n=1 Tax=Prosthecobacter sp. TaxID=1965333 RepID=UPI0038FDA47B
MKATSHHRCRVVLSILLLAGATTASAVDYTWDGTTNLWNSLHWNPGLVAGPTGASNANSATISSGQVNFANHDTFGNDGTTTSAIINLNGGTLASNGWFTTIWNLNLNGGTLLANGGANGSYPAFQLAGTVTVGGSQVSTINATTAINANNQINIGGNGNSTLEFNVADVTANASSDLVINATLQNKNGGAGSLTKSGAGTLELTGANTYSGGTTLNAGTLALGSSGAIGSSGTISLGGGTLQFSASNTTDYSARFSTAASQAYNMDTNGQNVTLATALTSSGGTLTKSGSGTLTLSNNNSSFTGDLTINGGTILATASGGGTTSTLGAANVARTIAVNSGGTLQFNVHDTFGQAGTTTPVAIVINAGGVVKNNGTYTTLPSLTLNGGELQVNGGANSSGFGAYQLRSVTVGGSSASQITTTGAANGLISLGQNGGDTVTFAVADATGNADADLTIAAVLRDSANGTSGLAKTGAGTMSISGANIYTGGTTLNAGTLALGSSGAIGSSGTITLGGGTLQFSASNTTDYSARFSTAASQAYNMDTNGQNVTLGTALTSSGGTLTKSGSGTLTFTAVNTYTGATTVSGGTLAVGAGGLISDSSAVKVTGAGATYDMSGITPASDTVGSIASVAGSFILLGGKQLIAGGDGTDTTLAGSISGTLGALTKVGAGTLTVTGATTYTGATTVNGGTLVINGGSNDSLGGTTHVVIGAAGTLDLGGFSQTTTGTFSMADGATLRNGTFITNNGDVAGNNKYTGSLTLGTGGAFQSNQRLLLANGGTASLTISAASTGSMTFGGDSGGGQNYVGVGGGAATLTVNGGSVNFTNATGGNGWMNIGSNSNASNGSLVVDGGNVNVGTVLKVGGVFNSDAGTNATSALSIANGTVTVGGGDVGTNNGVLFMNGGNGNAVANTGNATLTVGTAGVLNVKQIQAGEGGTMTINLDGGTIKAGADSTTFLQAATGLTVKVQNGGATFDTNGNSITVAAALVADGSGGLTKSGAGTLTLTGANSYTGGTILNQGTLSIGTGGTLGATTGTLAVNNTNSTAAGTNAILNLATAVDTTVGSLSGTVATPTSGTNTATINTQTGRNFTVNQTTAGTYAGVIAGAGNLTLGSSSTNALTLSGTHTYTGTTTISAGTLQLGNGGTTGSIINSTSISVATGATLKTNRSDSITLGQAITGAGNVEIANTSTGSTILGSASNTYTGTTMVTSGRLQVGTSGIGQTGTGAVTVSTGSTVLGSGTVRGNTFDLQNGSTLRPGDGVANSSHGTLTFTPATASGSTSSLQGSIILGITGATATDATFGGNTLGTAGYNAWVDAISGVGSHDRLVFSNPTSGTGYNLNFLTITGSLQVIGSSFTPAMGQVFNLLDWSNLVTANFTGFTFNSGYLTGNGDEGTDLDLPDLSATGLGWDFSRFSTSGNIVVVPEPSRALLLMLGASGLMLRRRRVFPGFSPPNLR